MEFVYRRESIRASDVGAPHGRDRWFALATMPRIDGNNVGNSEHDGQPATEVTQSIAARNGDNEARESQASESTRSSEQHAELANPQRDRLQGQWQDGDAKGQAGLCGGERGDEEQRVFLDTNSRGRNERPKRGIQEGQNTEPSRNCGCPWWEVESQVGRVVDGMPDRVGMLKGLGNAQVPLQAAAAWRLLTSHMNNERL